MPRPTREDLLETRRSEILTAAYKVFAQKGYHDTNIADIAAELGMGHGTFYRYFRNKLDIFIHVVDHVIVRIGEVVETESPSFTSSLEQYRAQLRRIGERLYDLFVSDEHLGRLLFYEAIGIDHELDRKLQEAMDVFGEYTAQYLENGIKKGFLRADLDCTTTALALNAMIFEGARRVLRGGDREAVKQVWIGTITDLICDGLRMR